MPGRWQLRQRIIEWTRNFAIERRELGCLSAVRLRDNPRIGRNRVSRTS
jgi:hypothetical protein